MRYFYTLLFFAIFASCDDFLDEQPDNRTTIDSVSKVAELVTGAYPLAAYGPFVDPRTDNARDKGFQATEFDVNTEMFFWNDFSINEPDTPLFYWNACYKAIAQANQALQSIEELGGGPEFDPYKGEALLCRAYAHFMLVNIWGEVYDPETAEEDLGIPYLTEPENTLIVRYERNTIREVYDMIEQDMLNGIELVRPDVYESPKYHFTPQSAHAFASRFYLYTGQWDEVIEHSNKALGDNPELLLRDWTDEYGNLPYNVIQAEYTSPQQPANLLLAEAESEYMETAHYGLARYQLSPTLANQLFLDPHLSGSYWTYRVFGTDIARNIPKFRQYFRVTNINTGSGVPYVTYILFSGDEVYLNRLEAKIMKNQLNDAVDDMNTILERKLDTSFQSNLNRNTISSFYLSTALDYDPYYDIPPASKFILHAVQEIRRREFYLEGLRWFDIRRFNLPVKHQDVLGNDYFLRAYDPRKLLQIPNEAVAFGTEPNPR